MSSKTTGKTKSEEKIVMTACTSHCGGTCLLKVHVKDGVITRIETDDGEEPQYRACLKGRAYRQRVYAPDRITQPLKRVGDRGEGKFEPISWDEALDTVATEITRVKETYGSASILYVSSGGDLGELTGKALHYRLLCMAGGCSEVWGNHSAEGAIFATVATFGTDDNTNTCDDLLNSRLIILWGCNPAESVMLTNTAWYLSQAREAGIKIVSVDPKYTSTSAHLANEWIPIRPGADAAMLIAMAYMIIKENLQDQYFLDTYTVGFDKFKDYVMGVEDGQPKTPQWAESITGVPATTTENLAREYATTKPAALLTGTSPGRTAFGEQYHRIGATLAAMTGNIGIKGGSSGVNAFGPQIKGNPMAYPFLKLGQGLEPVPNPVELKNPPRKNTFPSWGGNSLFRSGHVHQTEIADAILTGKAGGYPADYKLLYEVNTNYPNQYPNINRCVEALRSKSLEFIVVSEQFITPGAKFADIILPVNTYMERNNITTGPTVGFYGSRNKVIDSVGESKSHLEICNAIANRLGFSYTDKTEEQWLKQIAEGSPDIPDYEAFKKAGGHKLKLDEPYVAFKKQIEDPENNPFPTPSGKIEIYCQRIASLNNPLIPPIPKYIEAWESPADTLAQKYPLQLITTHFLRRAHSQYDNIPWLNELMSQAVLMNTADAESRSIKDGDMVKVFNDRGATVLPARVTERIMPGVVDIPEGAWYAPDKNRVDRGGSPNILTRDEHSPAGAYTTNTSLVQIEKA